MRVEAVAQWPISIVATQDISCGARLWSAGGKGRATVVVKATFSMGPRGEVALAAPLPILAGDQHHEGSLERSVVTANDLAPYLPRAEVVFSGHAYAVTPVPSMAVRLAVAGARTLVDKSLYVFGERLWDVGDQMTSPVPFTRIPMRWERASRGQPGQPPENPVGMEAGSGLPVYNVVDPHDLYGPAGLSPIAAHWPMRSRLLRDLAPEELAQPRSRIPDTFAWSFFHAAPPDQRCSFFQGDEAVLLEGLHPDSPRYQMRLMGAQPEVRVYGLESTGHRDVRLVADTLWIDPDHGVFCLVWRGNFELDDASAVDNAQIFAGLAMPGRAIPWPGAQDQVPAVVGPAAAQPSPVAAPDPVATAPAVAAEPARNLGATLASPGMTLEALAQQEVPPPHPTALPPSPQKAKLIRPEAKTVLAGGAVPAFAFAPAPVPGAPHSALESMALESMALESVALELVPSSASPSFGSMSATNPQAPSQLQELIRHSTEQEILLAGTPPNFDDEPTYAPDAAAVAALVESAERHATQAEQPPALPRGVRPEPRPGRAVKTTIRGLGETPSEAPPTTRVAPQPMQNLLAGNELPTAQLKIPDVLLKMAAQSARFDGVVAHDEESAVPTGRFAAPVATAGDSDDGPATFVTRPVSVASGEDDGGRPTFHSIEPPVFSQVAAKPPPVHQGEMRLEVERRIREGEGLAGLDLSDVDLSGFDLSGQKLGGSRLDRSKLARCRMHRIDLSAASMEGADLSGADLEGANLERANLVGAGLCDAQLRGALLTDTNFTTADIRRASFDRASGLRTIFCRSRADDASFTGSTLDAADFSEAILDQARFEGALLPELRCYEASAERAHFKRANLRGARFDGAVLSHACFDAAQGDDAIFDRAVLDGASLIEAHLVGASFTKASLRGANLTKANLGEARMNRANLTGANLSYVALATVTLDGADLSDVTREPDG